MIEVEKKFAFSSEFLSWLDEQATFLGEKLTVDIYYDTQDFSLTTNDLWLRKRNDNFELKVPRNTAKNAADRMADVYDELESDQEIAHYLKLPTAENLLTVLEDHGYHPCATINTMRKTYKTEGFTIVVDTMDYGYSLGEIEIMVETDAEVDRASQKIIKFATMHTIEAKPVRGKVIEYLLRFKRPHFDALVAAGITS